MTPQQVTDKITRFLRTRVMKDYVHISDVQGALTDGLLAFDSSLSWYDTWMAAGEVIQQGIENKWIDFKPRFGIMIMRLDDDVLPPFGNIDDGLEEVEPEPIPSTLPSGVDPKDAEPVTPKMGETKKPFEPKVTKQDIRITNANDWTCTACGNKLCNKDEAKCWRCEAPIVVK